MDTDIPVTPPTPPVEPAPETSSPVPAHEEPVA